MMSRKEEKATTEGNSEALSTIAWRYFYDPMIALGSGEYTMTICTRALRAWYENTYSNNMHKIKPGND